MKSLSRQACSNRSRIPVKGMRLLPFVLLCGVSSALAQQSSESFVLQGTVRDDRGLPRPDAVVVVGADRERTDASGRFSMRLPAGSKTVAVEFGGSLVLQLPVDLESDRDVDIRLHGAEAVTVNASVDPYEPDPAAQGYARSEVMDANPGRPGVPISVPGLPAETASGGIKAPQYFAPGVAGDHGEPIAQYLGIGSFLLPNNLTANAHGNGYADPNFVISGTIGGVVVDGGALNVLYGDHAVNLALTYDLYTSLPNSFYASTTGRDVTFGATWHAGRSSWIAVEGGLGNGWLQRPEEREQYKVNAVHTWTAGRHQLTALGIAYYGFSRIPGLIPLSYPVPSETIDGRQSDLTHTSVAALVDTWRLNDTTTWTTGAFFRTYSLDLRSNFGDGLIRQSEFRTVAGGSSSISTLYHNWSLLGGLELKREAPRGIDLDHFDEAAQRFTPVTSNDLTIYTTSPFAALELQVLRHVKAYVGVRRDQLCFDNTDRLDAANSFKACSGFTSPKVNLTFGSLQQRFLPQIGVSFGKAFHANDPRIGTGSGRGQLIAAAREYQLVATKSAGSLRARLVLGQAATSAEFAKIDADTGLQEDVGPALNRYLTLSISQRTASHYLQVSWSQADARDRQDGSPVPEAPRTIVDAVASTNRLPFGFSGKSEFEYVKAKPLGDGFTGQPLRELRLQLSRSFAEGRWTSSLDGAWLHGFSGQTLETLSVDPNVTAYEQPVGVPAASYATLTLRYNWSR